MLVESGKLDRARSFLPHAQRAVLLPEEQQLARRREPQIARRRDERLANPVAQYVARIQVATAFEDAPERHGTS